VDTVKVCAASAFAPPVVPVPDEAQPSLAASVRWYRSTVVVPAFAFITRTPAPTPAATAAAETTRTRRLRIDRRWVGAATGRPYVLVGTVRMEKLR
jgi:hypothetical protein